VIDRIAYPLVMVNVAPNYNPNEQCGLLHVWRPKGATQHGAGIHYKLVVLAEAQGYSNIIAEEVRYDQNNTLEEVLGSSQRYGYKYDMKSKWATQHHVQIWLDNMAYEQDLLNPTEREQLELYLQRATQLITSRT